MSAIGNWTLTMKTPMGDQTGTLSVTQGSDALTATLTGPDGSLQPVTELKQSGEKLSWKVSVRKPIPMTLHFDVSIEGDKLTGRFRPGMFPPSPVTGRRA